MRRTAGLLMLGFVGLGSVWACGDREPKPEGPPAKHREGRSEVLRGLMASKERVDPGALKGAGEDVKETPVSAQPTPAGTGGSGRPDAQGWAAGRVSWVGDDEVLFVDGQGEEREVRVEEGTRLRRDEQSAQLRDLSEGDEIRVTYEDTGEGWIARDLEAVPARKEPEPDPTSPPLR
ncbi:hypothetical protein D7Y13_13455 [Corallococcus praedator]|uniref:DUF5666 domain-containing protein n=1 Tax=Corallococcus praedator TaxID=2316724 RepID=A0ABX9QJ65_9BACT|nr:MULTISPECIES: hypothetical protein [Corallococcus]RKH30375.1 hypothetical protein D7X75_21230 [Corallococcus sp. CA031C]RKI09922.1 hypothetical protein D7Y13_13455 [Corallococcus praedator]